MGKHFRSIVRFCLAGFLWAHTLFIVDIRPAWTTKASAWLHLTTVETALFVLLITFSFVAGSGFWRGVGNVAYIYFFPFVAFFYLCRVVYYLLRTRTSSQIEITEPPVILDTVEEVPSPALAEASQASSEGRNKLSKSWFLRPFRRFTILWCLLLLFSSHRVILWASLVIVLLHLVRTVALFLRIALFSGHWLDELEESAQKNVDMWASQLKAVTRASSPDANLKNVWSILKGWEHIVRFVKNRALVARSAILMSSVLLGSSYLYLALIFSFVYYGIARLSDMHPTSWLRFLVLSIGMPLYGSNLPDNIPIRSLGIIQFLVIWTIGIASFVKFMRRTARSLSVVIQSVDIRLLSDEEMAKKRKILEKMFSKTKERLRKKEKST